MDSLIHDYDAVARREYYLRTRHLVGRAKKVNPPVATKAVAAKLPPKKTHAQRQKELEARIVRLQAKLEQLRAALKVLVEAAQKRSGVAKNSAEQAAIDKYQPPKASDPTSKYQKMTQKQKDAAAKAVEKYRDKNQVLESQAVDLNNKIKAIRDRIKRIQKTGSVGASTSSTQ